MKYPNKKTIDKMVEDYADLLEREFIGTVIKTDVDAATYDYSQGLKDMLKLIKKINKKP